MLVFQMPKKKAKNKFEICKLAFNFQYQFKMKKISIIAGILFSSLLFGQEQNQNTKDTLLIKENRLATDTIVENKYNPLKKPNTYRNSDNPNYWKNKLPKPGYWQQDVHYRINAKIDENTDIITATQKLTYWNNSNDTLDIVYFHLYQNAFQPDSYYDELQKENKKNPQYGKYESEKLGTTISDVLVNGQKVDMELDNTILKIYLPQTLYPNKSIKFEMSFKTYFDNGSVRRRMKSFNSWGYKHYNGVHWYPRICVYDAKFGWTKDQHLGKEFYGNFGTFDVELTFASNFIVEATGYLQNRDEMLPKSLREKLDVKNFKNKEWNSPPSTVIPYVKGETKTWIYHAENVHDFAFTADPTYRIGEARWKDKICYSLVQEPHASRWQNAADFGAECLKVFSENFGMYVYHKVIVADARDGMEYPMITLDGGSDPGYRDLLAHEIGHMWFFGQVGNNETYRALLDEGFTQFLTAWALIEIDGEYMVEGIPKSSYKQKFKKPFRAIDSEIYYSYIRDASSSKDPILTTHSDCFHGALGHGGGYRHVYYKTAAMLYNLQYILGDDLFLQAMKHYFNTWKIAHPYDGDFRNTIIQFTKVDLNWFFDQWLDTDKRLDYAIQDVRKIDNDEFAITFKRKKRMQSSIDFQVISKNGKIHKFHIPNNWFIKKTDAVILPKWHGWDLIHPTHTVNVKIPSGISDVVIDPTNRLADCYMPDNSWKKNISFELDHKLWQYPDWRNYEFRYRPDIWWNEYEGLKLGGNINGGYLNHHHLIDISAWYNSGLLLDKDQAINKQISYSLKYNTNLDNIHLNTRLFIQSRFIAGLHTNSLSISKKSASGKNKIDVKFLSMYRSDEKSVDFLLYPEMWIAKKLNNRIDVNMEHKYRYHYGEGKINLRIENSSIGSDYDYKRVVLTSLNKNRIGKIQVNTRSYIQIGSGDNWAPESKLGLSGANNEELVSNKFTQIKGFIPDDYVGYNNSINHFHAGGGLNLRGYSGYLAPEFDENGIITSYNYTGTSGVSLNAEVDFSQYLGYNFTRYGFNAYLFGDIGVITNEKLNRNNLKDSFSELRADAGIGITYIFNHFKPLETVKPLLIRFDMPLFLNRPPATDDNFVQMRWLIGISRAF